MVITCKSNKLYYNITTFRIKKVVFNLKNITFASAYKTFTDIV